MTRVAMNDLHAAAHELTNMLRGTGVLGEKESLYVEKFPHMPHLLMPSPTLDESGINRVSNFLSHKRPDGWEIGDTRREALVRMESMTHMLTGFMYYTEE